MNCSGQSPDFAAALADSLSLTRYLLRAWGWYGELDTKRRELCVGHYTERCVLNAGGVLEGWRDAVQVLDDALCDLERRAATRVTRSMAQELSAIQRQLQLYDDIDDVLGLASMEW
uniref:Uncharacterized protein n=1 Tax=viral metagenome TaxID=1070528 RepID=A0A6C0AUW0_9ZZZZ